MNISQNGVDLIKKYEGCVLHAYKPVPTEKYWTIGYGHYGPDVKENQKITQKQAEDLLKKDLEKFVHGVITLLHTEINQNQLDALVSFAYNLGVGTLKKSTLLELINKKDFKNAANEFGKFVNSNGHPLPGLVKRRNEEKELFVKPIPNNTVEVIKNVELRKEPNMNKENIIRILKVGEKYKLYGEENGFLNLGNSYANKTCFKIN